MECQRRRAWTRFRGASPRRSLVGATPRCTQSPHGSRWSCPPTCYIPTAVDDVAFLAIRCVLVRLMRVSVLIPTYNAERFIRETIDSVRAQTHQDWELIVVDDGSSDRTLSVLAALALEDSRVHVLRQATSGTQGARNLALSVATGEWIALLDHDDVWLPQKLERQLEIARRAPHAALLFTNYSHWDGRNDLKVAFSEPERIPRGDVLNSLARHCLFGALTVLVRRSTLIAAGGFDTQFLRCGDWDLWLRLCESGILVEGTPELLARWRVGDGGLSTNRLEMRREEVRVLEAALARSRTAHRRRMYERALRDRRTDFCVRGALDGGLASASLARVLIRGWMSRPSRIRLLELALAQVWPDALGGGAFRRRADRTFERKF